MAIIDDLRKSFREGSTPVRLIYINVLVFIAIRLIELVGTLSGNGWLNPVSWFAMPTELSSFIRRPWTIFTYMFLHYDIIHIIFNMLCLHWFGQLFIALIGNRLVWRTYLIGGLVGGAACLLCGSVWAHGSVLLGASAGVLAVLLAVSVYEPNYSVSIVFVGTIRLKYYALIFIAIDILSIAGWSNAGGHVAHLGGAIAGALLAIRWKQHGLPQTTTTSFGKNLFRRKPKVTIIRGGRPLSDMEYNTQKREHSQEVDRILDKIKASGYDSLTKKERQTLFDESKK